MYSAAAAAELLWDSYHMDADSACNIALDLLR